MGFLRKNHSVWTAKADTYEYISEELFFYTLAEVPGVAREVTNFERKKLFFK